MDKMKQLLTGVVAQVSGEQDVKIDLAHPDKQHGDYSTNIALRLAKQLGKNPRELANQIANELSSSSMIETVEVAGPGFINITAKPAQLAQVINSTKESAPGGIYGANDSGHGQTVICEYPSPNMAKPYSAGHIRPALQGAAVANLMGLNGYNVITDNHLGDSGTPFGKWVIGFLNYSSDERLDRDGINELARVYIQITADLKAEAKAGKTELSDQVQSWLQKLEDGDEQALAYSKRFNELSLDHMHQVMERLDIATDYEYGESFFVQRGQELTDELLKSGLAEQSKGAVIVNLESEDIDTPIMLRKANGTALYATTDLATIEFREKEWAPTKVFIHTGQEQAFYFNQLNALTKLTNFKPVIVHLWHGLVDQIDQETGERAKMSSRKGVILLNDLLDKAEQIVADNSKPDVSQDSIKKIAVGAIKFADFMADRKRGTLFDWNTIFTIHGFSGPAIQYAAVRINSILSKAKLKPELVGDYDFEPEHQLLVELADFPELIKSLASGDYELHKLAAYLYGLAREFNRYYESTPVLNSPEDEQQNRLWLLSLTVQVLGTGLSILGIEVPSEM